MTISHLKTGASMRIRAVAAAAAVCLSGCGGGGGGGSDDIKKQPAPQTFNGLVLTLYSQGVNLTFIRAQGDAVTGVETGAVTMTEDPRYFFGVDPAGAQTLYVVSDSISGGRYTYQRTSPEAGVLIIEGSGSGVGLNDSSLEVTSTYFKNPTFSRRYDILFGTDGSIITGVNVNDSGEGLAYPGILWNQASLRLFGGASVPIAWDLTQSQGLNLPKLYPAGVSPQRLVITPTNLADPATGYQFLSSTFTRFSDAFGDFIEEGIGNKDVPPDPALTLINFDYQPDPNSTNLARIRIYEQNKPTLTYQMTFLDLEKGTYVRDDGSTGTFEFPFID